MPAETIDLRNQIDSQIDEYLDANNEAADISNDVRGEGYDNELEDLESTMSECVSEIANVTDLEFDDVEAILIDAVGQDNAIDYVVEEIEKRLD